MWAPVLDGRALEHRRVIDAIDKDFADGVVDSPQSLIGQCYQVTREASYVLFEMGIRHALTIGSILVDGKLYYSFDRSVLLDELGEGYRPNEPAMGHAWLTLQDGSVLDLTILAAVREKRGLNQRSVRDSVFVSGMATEFKLEHKPLLVGFAYHFIVVSAPITDAFASTYEQWFNDYHAVESRYPEHEELWRVSPTWQFSRIVRAKTDSGEGGMDTRTGGQENERALHHRGN